MLKEKRLSDSEILDRFVEDADVINVTRMYGAGLYTLNEFTERMKYLRQCLVELGNQTVEEEQDAGPWEAA